MVVRVGCYYGNLLKRHTGHVPAQDVLFALILWYVEKNLILIVGVGPIRDKEFYFIFRSDQSHHTCVYR